VLRHSPPPKFHRHLYNNFPALHVRCIDTIIFHPPVWGRVHLEENEVDHVQERHRYIMDSRTWRNPSILALMIWKILRHCSWEISLLIFKKNIYVRSWKNVVW